MKKISILLAFAMVVGCGTPDKKGNLLSGKVSGEANNNLSVNLPIDGKYFAGNNQEISIKKDGSYSVEIPEEVIGMAFLHNHFVPAYLFVDKQEQYVVDFQGEEVTYDSDNQKMFQLLNDLELFADVRSTVDVEKHTDLESKTKYYSELLQQRKEILDKAREELQLSEVAYEKLKNLVALKVVDLQSADFFFTFRLFYEQTPEKNKEFADVYLNSWEEIYQKAFQNSDLSAYDGQTAFLSRYRILQDIKNTGTLQFESSEKPYFIREIDFFRANLPQNVVEYAWANTMYEGLMQGNFEKEWIANFEEFKAQFPSSKLTDLLIPYVNKVVEYHNSEKGFSVNFVENYQNINSLDELFAKYQGKVLYIDIWATWCVPCRKELQYSKENHSTLETLGVIPVYLSIDKNSADNQWKTMIKNLKLEGVHIRANEALQKQLGEFVRAIPHYIIVGKDAKIKEKTAKRPSDKNQLFEQLKNYL
ncbi:TlpA family protein disulfide reductase [Capnocytophaga canimorsus]|uniref:TlpA family protein disulfide reductase n=1 Tax=Capnocytophaga canimorsus TaxID=28188 RepID=UPI0037D31AD5